MGIWLLYVERQMAAVLNSTDTKWADCSYLLIESWIWMVGETLSVSIRLRSSDNIEGLKFFHFSPMLWRDIWVYFQTCIFSRPATRPSALVNGQAHTGARIEGNRAVGNPALGHEMWFWIWL
jgi:hypothetical protein